MDSKLQSSNSKTESSTCLERVFPFPKAPGNYYGMTVLQHSFTFFPTSLLEYKCFTMLCQFLLYNKVNQLYVYIYPHIPSLLRLPPTLPTPSLQVITKHRADLPVLCSSFPLAMHFTSSSVYTSMLLFHFIPASPFPPGP